MIVSVILWSWFLTAILFTVVLAIKQYAQNSRLEPKYLLFTLLMPYWGYPNGSELLDRSSPDNSRRPMSRTVIVNGVFFFLLFIVAAKTMNAGPSPLDADYNTGNLADNAVNFSFALVEGAFGLIGQLIVYTFILFTGMASSFIMAMIGLK